MFGQVLDFCGHQLLRKYLQKIQDAFTVSVFKDDVHRSQHFENNNNESMGKGGVNEIGT